MMIKVFDFDFLFLVVVRGDNTIKKRISYRHRDM